MPLTNGLNTITIHAVDLAGNCSTTNVSFTLDYSSATPPNLTTPWPPDGTSISGTNFTLQAQLDDDTATVTAQVVDTDGDTNTVQGLVERSGRVWAQNLPLAPGTNILTITATDAAGLSVTTNVTLVQSPVLVTMNPLNTFDQANVSISGAISDPTCSLTINGDPASPDTNGNWEADNVPVSPTGTAVFNVQILNSNSVQVGSQQFFQVQPPMVVLESDSSSYISAAAIPALALWQFYQMWGGYPPGPTTFFQSKSINWSYLSGGTADSTDDVGYGWLYYMQISEGPGPTSGIDTNSSSPIPPGIGACSAPWEEASYTIPVLFGNEFYNNHARVMIAPSGQAPTGQNVLYLVQAQVFGEYGSPNPPINTIQIQGQTLTPVTNCDGSVWGQTLLSAPAGAYEDVTPDPPGNINYNVVQTTPTLQIIDNITSNVLSGETNTVIVGQQMNLSCQLSVTNSGFKNSMLTNFQWTVPGYAISNYVVAPDTSSAYVATNFPTTNSTAVFYWVDGASNRVLECSAMIDGVTISNEAVFNVLAPTAKITPQTASVQVQPFVGQLRLIFGGSYGGTSSNGISFFYTNSIPSGFSGTIKWVQIDSAPVTQLEDTNLILYSYTETGLGPYLDTAYPYAQINQGYPADVSERSKPARGERMKTSHFEGRIASGAGEAAQGRDEYPQRENTAFDFNFGSQWLVAAADCA